MYNDFRHLLFGGKRLQNIQNFTAIDSKHLNIRRSVLFINLMEEVRRQHSSLRHKRDFCSWRWRGGWAGQGRGVGTSTSKRFHFHSDVKFTVSSHIETNAVSPASCHSEEDSVKTPCGDSQMGTDLSTHPTPCQQIQCVHL